MADDEYRKVISGAGVAPLLDWTTLRIAGGDRASFLHNLCTNDVRTLAPGEGQEAFLTDVKGKIVAHFVVLAGEDELLLVTVPGQAQRIITHLDRYIIREDVQLADESPSLAWLIVVGRQSVDSLERLCSGCTAKLAANWAHAVVRVAGESLRLVRCEWPWCDGFMVGRPSAHVGAIARRLGESGAVACSEHVWHTVRIESGWPLYDVDFDASHLPQEVGRDAQAISFRKGCYLGQETIARIDALGHVNKRLATIAVGAEDDPKPLEVGAELFAGDQVVGVVRSACWSPTLIRPLALAMVRRGFNEAGSEMRCGDRTALVINTPAISKP